MNVAQTKDREVDFDVETAIRVCRLAGYYEHAVFLADKHDQHDSYLKTQLEDLHNYKMALEYIGRLEFEEACFTLAFLLLCKRSYFCGTLLLSLHVIFEDVAVNTRLELPFGL